MASQDDISITSQLVNCIPPIDFTNPQVLSFVNTGRIHGFDNGNIYNNGLHKGFYLDTNSNHNVPFMFGYLYGFYGCAHIQKDVPFGVNVLNSHPEDINNIQSLNLTGSTITCYGIPRIQMRCTIVLMSMMF